MTTEPLLTWPDRALAILRAPGSTLYGLLDAAQDSQVLALIHEGDRPFQSLYQGPSAIAMASVAPYLVQLDPEQALLEQLVSKGWGRNWGIYLRSRLPLAEVRRHLRHFTMVEPPDGRPIYFRFYDPRVFRVFIPACNPEECRAIFEGIESILVEGPDGRSINLYRLVDQNRLEVQSVTEGR
jgi:hypothetical protein